MSTERRGLFDKPKSGGAANEKEALHLDQSSGDWGNAAFETPEGFLGQDTAPGADNVFQRSVWKTGAGQNYFDRHKNTNGPYDEYLERMIARYVFTIPNESLTSATGTITVAGDPAENTTIQIGSRTYRWRSSGLAQANDILIDPGQNANMASNIVHAVMGTPGRAGINYHEDTVPSVGVTAAASSGVVTVTALRPGKLGNSIQLVSTSGNVTVSGATLASGGLVTLAATESLYTGNGIQSAATAGYFRTFSERVLRWAMTRTTTTGSVGFDVRNDSSVITTIAAQGGTTREVLDPSITIPSGVFNVRMSATSAAQVGPLTLVFFCKRILV